MPKKRVNRKKIQSYRSAQSSYYTPEGGEEQIEEIENGKIVKKEKKKLTPTQAKIILQQNASGIQSIFTGLFEPLKSWFTAKAPLCSKKAVTKKNRK